jgi:hypothetical protein
MAPDALLMLLCRVRRHVDELTQHARPHRAAVQAAAPVLELGLVACPAILRVQRCLPRTETSRRRPLRLEGTRPVGSEKTGRCISRLSRAAACGHIASLAAAGCGPAYPK